jgi:hypothetical protein
MKIALHFKGAGTKTLDLPAPPVPKAHFSVDGRLYWVDSLLYSAQSTTWGKPTCNVFLRQLGDVQTAVLKQTWAEWSQPVET